MDSLNFKASADNDDDNENECNEFYHSDFAAMRLVTRVAAKCNHDSYRKKKRRDHPRELIIIDSVAQEFSKDGRYT